MASLAVESCIPNPCQNGGQCVVDGRNRSQCLCQGHFTGIFCHVTWCDVSPCGDQGSCNLTITGYQCHCLPGYTGDHCTDLITPCVPSPCGSHGQCVVVNGSVICRCQVWYEGPHCELYRPRIPYKPLSQRMLEEPFWLGLITVFTVLVLILFVYCIKRKFADKIEKLLAEEIEKSKTHASPSNTGYSLSSTQPSVTPASLSPQTHPKSLLSRIRKHSIRTSRGGSISPTDLDPSSLPFTFDDLLKRAQASSKKREVSEPPEKPSEKNSDEKSRILASLVTSSPGQRRMSLDEFFGLSERKVPNFKKAVSTEEPPATKETSFMAKLSPLFARYRTPSFSNLTVKEPSGDQNSSSDSLSGEARTSEVRAEVSPVLQPSTSHSDNDDNGDDDDEEDDDEDDAGDDDDDNGAEDANGEDDGDDDDDDDGDSDQDSKEKMTRRERLLTPPEIQITPDEPVNNFLALMKKIAAGEKGGPAADPPSQEQKCTFLEVPKISLPLPLDCDQMCLEVPPPPPPPPPQSRPKRKDFPSVRKYSVELPTPKILITANSSSCESDEPSPPRTPNPVKPMTYLSPLAVICSPSDRTISESNLSTSGYSSLSSPGLSRCNSSSPLSDDLEAQQNAGNRAREQPSPQKMPSSLSPSYLIPKFERQFQFPLLYHCFEHAGAGRRRSSVGSVGLPMRESTQGKGKLLFKNSGAQDSIEDEGIVADTRDFAESKTEVAFHKSLDIADSPDLDSMNPKVFSESELCRGALTSCEIDPGRDAPETSAGLDAGFSVAEVPVHRSLMSGWKSLSSDTDDAFIAFPPTLGKSRQKAFTASAQSFSSSQASSVDLDADNPEKVQSVRRPLLLVDDSSNELSTESTSPLSEDLSLEKRLLLPSQRHVVPEIVIHPVKPTSHVRHTATARNRDQALSAKRNSFPSTPGDSPDSPRWRQLPVQRTYPLMSKKRERVQSVDSVGNSGPSDSEDEAVVRHARVRGPGDATHSMLRRQEAVTEDDDSDDSSGDTTVLLRKPAHSGGPLLKSAKLSDKSPMGSNTSVSTRVSQSDSSSAPSLQDSLESGSKAESGQSLSEDRQDASQCEPAT